MGFHDYSEVVKHFSDILIQKKTLNVKDDNLHLDFIRNGKKLKISMNFYNFSAYDF